MDYDSVKATEREFGRSFVAVQGRALRKEREEKDVCISVGIVLHISCDTEEIYLETIARTRRMRIITMSKNEK